MAFEKAKSHLDRFGLADRIILTQHSSATVAEAAEALFEFISTPADEEVPAA